VKSIEVEVKLMARAWEHHEWIEPYRAAVLEMNPNKVAARIAAAESAIKARIVAVKSAGNNQELRALQDALRVLRLLEKQEPPTELPS
jgi:hypothetical protein